MFKKKSQSEDGVEFVQVEEIISYTLKNKEDYAI